jgi:hypothetical protein
MKNNQRLLITLFIASFVSVFVVPLVNAQEVKDEPQKKSEKPKAVKTGDKIYTWIDAKGDRIYSDVPREGAEVMQIEKGTDYSSQSTETPDWTKMKPKVVEDAIGYEHFNIVSPANEATVRNNGGNIQVALDVRPKLMPGHRLKLEMDGNEVSGGSSVISLTNVDRGAHTFIAHITDGEGKVIQSTNAVVVYMHKASK